MISEIVLWVFVLLALIGVAVAFIHPASRPYAKKYWWAAVALAALAASFVLFRKRTNRITDVIAEGRNIAEDNNDVLDQIINTAEEQVVLADLDLKRKVVESEQEGAKFDAAVDAIKKVDDSVARRKALIDLVESYK